MIHTYPIGAACLLSIKRLISLASSLATGREIGCLVEQNRASMAHGERTVNRFMVWMGLVSLLLPIVSVTPAAHAEMPRHESSPLSVPAPGIQWHETLDSGWAESRRRNLPMVIYITSDNCHYCDAMRQNTWCNASVRSRIAKGFIPIRLSRHRNSATLGRIQVEMYPHYCAIWTLLSLLWRSRMCLRS